MKKALALCLLLLMLLPSCADAGRDAWQTDTADAQTGQAQTLPSMPQYTPPTKVDYALTITEVMADNRTLCLGHDRDWVEIYNAEDTEVSLTGYFLTDDQDRPYRFALSEYTIPATSYLVIDLPEDAMGLRQWVKRSI